VSSPGENAVLKVENTCGSGRIIAGGGELTTDVRTQKVVLVESYPNSNGTGWIVEWQQTAAGGTSWGGTVWILCTP
jgi:hypothetical protein